MEARRERRVESLGWLTESSVMPKKQKVIEGVGAGSIVELRAQLYQTQEAVKQGDSTVLVRSRKKSDLFSKKNPGVDDRETRDKLIFKQERDGTASYEALEKKAQLYDKLVRGELPDEEEKEKYSVDFLRKGFLEDEKEEMERNRRGETSADDDEPESLSDMNFLPGKPTYGPNHKELVREVNRETVEAREKAAELKQRRQSIAEKQRARLRKAFVKKELEKHKSSAANSHAPPAEPLQQEQQA
ncbi:hypothetical protein SELMODRAFT_78672 [Selaginella moellendorffii]|uniref:Uncharacterized protein n=1 Tax=Selaginella moellendorffii TaxID=88036 RepID=D8QVL4_SELML|nr:uncharacterized protein At4g18257 [Selaginella moellendorffii]XP_002980465.1 uncharacterized protein At4g18257 [Selaginella moellendorffii]EFJ18725.1 hypothetical protein SELMODRAFT_112176 [Selaginella moellendorffii]EFJ36082.1 hypothetical protein SELMODRAFT_78672 [Selaginella moellendorffii]|eukprot:XP_002962619.1 uncharacterized protein At4g18257 [Selaginella moellendorffii]